MARSVAGQSDRGFVGISFDDYAKFTLHSGDRTRIDAFSSLGNTRSIAVGRLSYTLGLQGATMQLDTTCSSSLLAVHLACQSLRSGESNLALAGGVSLMIAPEPTIGFCKLKALSPDGRSKTFDASADGYGRGEGCGIVVLKRLSDAIAHQDNILAIVRGSAVNHDGQSNGLTAPNGEAQATVIRQAIAAANLDPSDIQYVETHGTGTALGDPIEVLALAKALGGDRVHPLRIGSVKTNIGHLEAAAGAASLIKVVLAMQHRQIPPHLHLKTPNPYIPWDKLAIEVPTQMTDWTGEPRRAGVSSFGMSGTNAHVIVEEFQQEPKTANQKPACVLTLSAKSEKALQAQVWQYVNFLETTTESIENVCFTANTGRSHFDYRVAIVGENLAQLREKLQAAQAVRVPINRPKIAFLFTGQGSQYADMGKQLYETQTVFREAIDQCADLLRSEFSLLEVLYGNDSRLHQTQFTQPALFAIEYALTCLWRSWGIVPDVVMGHSLGEYVAACVAGVFSLADALKLVTTRARLMQALP
ncbi:MAG: type I polyketide synthase, partial [Leptolyngbyaceae cyanobacterium SM1_3_5]|nr:type I polyketide synthase [Leptolyngbyaceae cyanobacterium SM1_3_5]